MQVPPEQPVGPGGYPRPPGYGQPPEKFVMDTVMGVIMIVLAALGACGSLALIGIGGLGAAAGSTVASEKGGVEVAAAGGMAMVMGVILLAVCAAEVLGGVWMLKSLKKGFMLILIIGAIGLILNIVSGATAGHFNFIGVGVGLIFPGYSAARLFGNFGPKPTD
jgi:hypothetical protein